MTASEDQHNAPSGLDTPAATGLSENKASTQSPGEMLREGRLAHDYSIDDLCAQTKLGPKTVNALEDNDFEALSQPVFARGYYRQCAKVLDIDPERITKAYAAWAGELEKTAPGAVSNVNIIPQDVTPGGSRFGWLLLLLVIVAAAITIMLLVSPGSDSNDAEGDDAVATATTAAPASDVEGGAASSATDPALTGESASNTAGAAADTGNDTDNEPVARTGETSSGRNVNQSLGITPPNANDEDDGSGEATTPDVPANRLELSFEKRSWVRVTDANGNRLASGIFEAGQTETYEAPAPYQLRLGFAPGVKVNIGGTPVDVAARANGSTVANISVEARGDGEAAGSNTLDQ